VSRPELIELGLASAAEITAALDPPLIPTRVTRLHGGSTDVFEIAADDNRAVILKAYPDEPAWKMRKEAFIAKRFAAVAPVPRWLAIDGSRARLPRAFAMMTRLPGQSMRAHFQEADAERLFQDIGAMLRGLHTVAAPRFGYLLETEVATPFETNAEFMATYFASKFRDFARQNGDPDLRRRLETIVTERSEALAECGAPVLCHNDFHPGNVLVAEGPDGVRRVSGLIDFENAVAADPLFDLAKALDYTAHECPAGRAPLAEGYGALDRPGADEALVVYRLFHKLELLNWFEAVGEGRFGPAKTSLLADLAALATSAAGG
jgi:aminoglycoside phosphotransferase (APT) family kinase protein